MFVAFGTTLSAFWILALTLVLYLLLYAALLVAYVSVLKYMAEKPAEVLQMDAAEQAATPPGAITSPVVLRGRA